MIYFEHTEEIMPEGPEVKRTAEGLARAMTNKTLTNIEVLSGRYLKEDIGGLADFRASLPIKVVLDVTENLYSPCARMSRIYGPH